MADKLHHGKAKHHAHSKKGRAKQRAASPLLAQREGGLPEQPAAPAEAVAPPVRVTAAKTGNRYPYINAELKWIGILAGIIVVILIVLALVLH